MLLQEQLNEAKHAFMANAPEDLQSKIFQHIKELQELGVNFGLMDGDKAPNFSLTNPLGEQVTLYDELAKGPVVLAFYRGGWCPFCNVQLRSYQRILPDIQKYEGQLIAISPQSPDNTLSMKEKAELTFQVLSDPEGKVSGNYKVLFELPRYLQAAFKDALDLDLAEYNQTARWILPIPGTFIIDREGIVRATHVDPDFMSRMEPQAIIEQLQKL
ncbi:alkyl hydroperoxide reductase [Pullulanibacillus camelliae]|uniref:thioredoxin-dependent peroxiredoxin n=1 Tax=Pullulanibacillus camelliae TaxID=1707096 RepID=A0A8J2VGG4_9BACL|nr:peroxiredoxin-like family protein [Pullulanibacillus camelliae]GGE30228.1 alkyl hydroperoxide reductase [Pullulanibacillus camelliae]